MSTLDQGRRFEIRCPIYGFVSISDWERDIIGQPPFQRLRRIRQLAWTDYLYPGAMHNRFEHSLGVMHMAMLLYNNVKTRSCEILKSEFKYNADDFDRNQDLLRLAALLHDLGHCPFSHAAEDLFPLMPQSQERFKHEQYSAAIIRTYFSDVIQHHPQNRHGLTAEHVASFLEGNKVDPHSLFWRDLLDGQMDADRMDYLLRDSHHAGVDYGRYDWQRLLHTVQAIPDAGSGAPRLGVSEGGFHAAEGLILARYFMFTQVYFHRTRVAFDIHLQGALRSVLEEGVFPAPVFRELDEYLQWDDWRVLGLLAAGDGGEHGKRLAHRDHYRAIAHTPETPSPKDIHRLYALKKALGDLLADEFPADKSWYKAGPEDIPVLSETAPYRVKPLSEYSSVVLHMSPIQQVILYVRPEDRDEAAARLEATQA